MTADREPYAFAVRRLDAIFSAANDYEEGAKKMRAEFVVIPRTDLPEVVEKGGRLCVDDVLLAEGKTAAARRREARRFLAAAEYLDAREAREAEAAKEAELTARRDVLVDEVHARAYGFGGKVGRSTLVAIGMLMEAQDKLAEYEAQENAAAVAGAPSEPSP